MRAHYQKSHGQRRELVSGGDSRHRRKAALEAAVLAIGLYQVEELII